MAKTKTASAAVEKPKAKTSAKVAAPVGAALANAFAQSAAFFGKKASYAAPEEPVTEATDDAEAKPIADEKPAQTAGEESGEKKSKKKKKDKKRKLDQVTPAENADGEDATKVTAADGADDATAATSVSEPVAGSVAAALGQRSDKSDRTIFVGNVSLDATQSALKTFFSSCGKVESVRLRFLPVAGTAVSDHGNQKLVMKVCANQKIFTDKRDFCHAYVTFASIESVEKAMLKNRSLFLNKTLRIDHENPVVDPQRSVFVGNLSFQMTDETVWAFFDKQLKTDDEPHPVENVRLIRDRETGAGKGFGYVLLKGKALAAKALSLAGKKLQNRELRVQVCGKRTKNKKGEDAALKHEGRRASGAAGRVITKKKARGELVPPPPVAKKAKLTDTKKPVAGKKPLGGKKVIAGAAFVGKGKKTGKPAAGGKKDKKPSRKVGGLAPGVKPKKPKHEARKARQAAEAAAAAKSKK